MQDNRHPEPLKAGESSESLQYDCSLIYAHGIDRWPISYPIVLGQCFQGNLKPSGGKGFGVWASPAGIRRSFDFLGEGVILDPN